MVTWWPLDVDGTDIFGGLNGLLLGDVAFSTGNTSLVLRRLCRPRAEPEVAAVFAERRHRGQPDARRELCRRSQLHLHHAWHQHRLAADQYPQLAAAARLEFGHHLPRPGLPLRGALQHAQPGAWRQHRRVHRDLDPGCGQHQPLRRHLCFAGNTGTPPALLAGSSIDSSYNTLPFNYQTKPGIAWCCPRLPTRACAPRCSATPGQSWPGFPSSTALRPSARASRSVSPNSWGRSAVPQPVDVAVDYVQPHQRAVRRSQPGLLRRRHRHAHDRARLPRTRSWPGSRLQHRRLDQPGQRHQPGSAGRMV